MVRYIVSVSDTNYCIKIIRLLIKIYGIIITSDIFRHYLKNVLKHQKISIHGMYKNISQVHGNKEDSHVKCYQNVHKSFVLPKCYYFLNK